MRVYVESNFVLELALRQEEHESCERILKRTAEDEVQLILPAYALVEPQATLAHRANQRQSTAEETRAELRQLGRSDPYAEQADALVDDLTALLVGSEQEEQARLQDTLDRLAGVAKTIPLTASVIDVARGHQQRHGLSPQDAVVYASILQHLNGSAEEESIFLNRDAGDFGDPDIQDGLDDLGCEILFRFEHGLRRIQSTLG